MTTKHIPSDEQSKIYSWFKTSRVAVGKSEPIISQNLLVRARAGTGKTTTILEGVEQAPEQSILLAAFNKSIATELQSRVRNPRVEAKTLHGLGFKFLKRNWKDVDLNDNRAMDLAKAACDDAAPDSIIRMVANLHTKAREIEPYLAIRGAGKDLIDLAVKFNLVPDEGQDESGWDLGRVCDMAHKAMQLAMIRTKQIDFADMIFLPLVHKMTQMWYNMVVVDEAQDMTTAQLALAILSCKRNGRICVVGDDRQAIYGFRGADSGSLDRLKTKLNAAELTLTMTRRCPKLVVNLAKALVPDFCSHESAPDGEILRCDSDKMVATAVEGDFILSRTNAPLIKICMALLKKGTRARIKGRDIGRGIVALIRKLRVNLVTELEPKLTEYTDEEIARATKKLSEAAAEERCQFLVDQQDIILALAEGTSMVSELIARCEELFSDDAENRAVMCSSVHRSKGLEATNVFLLEGTFRNGAEEDNIKYVAITRSKSRLSWVTGYEKAKPVGARS